MPRSSFSKLAALKLFGTCLSRNSFASLLRGCPLLWSVDLQGDVVLLSGPPIDGFRHEGVTTLLAPIRQVFMPDPASGPAPRGSSLLIHFLSLETWHAYSRETTLIVPIEHIKSEAQAYCPHVTEIDTWVTPSPVLSNLIADIFDDLQCVTFAYEQFSADIVTALLFHKETLVNIAVKVDGKACGIERDEPPPEETRLKASDRLALHPHTMDMDFVEQSHWVCKNLRVLKVLIRGLDTKEKIDRALALWKEGSNRDGTNDVSSERNQGRKRNADGEEMPEQSKIAFHGGGTNPLIDVRVARHLLKFDKLNTVWLGTSTHHV